LGASTVVVGAENGMPPGGRIVGFDGVIRRREAQLAECFAMQFGHRALQPPCIRVCHAPDDRDHPGGCER
jgi:hypothetical protein